MSTPDSHKPRALAISPTAIGDTLLGFPAMDALAREYRLDAIVHMRYTALLAGRSGINRVFAYRNSPLMRIWLGLRLAPYRYERVVIMHANDNILRLLPLLRYERAANLQGWKREDLRLTPLDTSDTPHMVDKRLALAKWCGVDAKPAEMQIELTPEDMQAGADWIRENGLRKDRLIAICPGAALVYKRWPVERFGAAARELAREGWDLAVLGSKAEQGLFESIRAQCPQAAPLMGRSLRLAAAVLAQSRMLIGNDTGTMHMALAVGCPVLIVFGPSSPETFGPRDPRSRILRVELSCEPCDFMKCKDPRCLSALKTETLLKEAREMLGEIS